MKDGEKTRVEDLLFPELIQMIGEIFRYDEAVTTTTLSPLVRGMTDTFANPLIRFGILARTATLFLVDHTEFLGAISSADAPPVLPQLPPLPYPRIAVECAQEMVWTLGDQDNGATAELEMFCINEALQGEEWNVILLLAGADEYVAEIEAGVLAKRQLLVYTLKSDGGVWQLSGTPGEMEDLTAGQVVRELEPTASLSDWVNEIDERFVPPVLYEVYFEPEDKRGQILRSIPVEFAHLVNARGVTVEPLDIPRPQRRRFERHRLVHPRVYFVHIGGEDVESYPGHGDREYHCRWLVRGHWRHFQDGSTTWVRPYVKGPPGAPWRGRPVYVIDPAA